MRLSFKQLKNLPVYTKNNEFLGKIQDLEFSVETQNISRYLIKSSQVVKRLAGKNLIINANQVVNLDEHKMVVEDGVIKEKEGKLIKEPAPL